MRKLLFKKSQLDEAFLMEGNRTRPSLLKEGSYEELQGKIQPGDIFQVGQKGQEKTFKVDYVSGQGQTVLEYDNGISGSKLIVTGFDPEEGVLGIKYEDDRGKTSEFKLSNVELIKLKDENGSTKSVVETDLEDDNPKSDDSEKNEDATDALNRKKELADLLSTAQEGDILRLLRGQEDEDEEITNETVIDLKVDERKAAGTYVTSVSKIEGAEENELSDLEDIEKIVVNRNSFIFSEKNAETFSFKISDQKSIESIVAFDVIKPDEQESEKGEEEDTTAYEKAKEKLSDEQLSKMVDDPLYNQALRTSMEIDDILKKLGPKKGLKGKDRKEWQDKKKYEIRWESKTIGEGGHKLEKGESFIASYEVNENMLTWKRLKSKNEDLDQDVTFELNNIRSYEGDNMYKADVRIYTYDKTINTLVPEQTGIFKKIKSGVKG